MDFWSDITADRLALAELLDTLAPGDWKADSLCGDWTVRDVAAHILAMATVPKSKAFMSYVQCRGNLDRSSAALLARVSHGLSPTGMADAIRHTAVNTHTPPGLRAVGVYGELVTHIADICYALSVPMPVPLEHQRVALDYMRVRVKGNTRFNLTLHGRAPVLHCAERIDGLQLRATDIDWSTGEGPLVEGPAALLLLAMTGRAAALSGLDGPGVEALKAR